MKKLLLLLIVLLSGCFVTYDRATKCGRSLASHKLIEDYRGEMPLPNGDKMVIFICVRKDVDGNALCNFKDTFIIRQYPRPR
jgi:hypothetical protein